MSAAENVPVVTIDGPSGVGKGTVSLRVAEHTGWHILDSGSLYRLTALQAQKSGIDLKNELQLANITKNIDVSYQPGDNGLKIFLRGEEVSDVIRSEQIGYLASTIAALPAVREALLQRQRDFARPPGLVADGRDMGTVVFPQAPLKIFLTASAEERANRRYKQLKEKGIDANLPSLVNELTQRDERDAKRRVAPLVAADDAVTLDTTSLSIDAVTDQVMKLLRQRFALTALKQV